MNRDGIQSPFEVLFCFTKSRHCRDFFLGENVRFLLDPKFFNYAIMVMYALSASRWAISGKLADTCYWLSALAITATVTFLYKH
jgi:hypothetical protein